MRDPTRVEAGTVSGQQLAASRPRCVVRQLRRRIFGRGCVADRPRSRGVEAREIEMEGRRLGKDARVSLAPVVERCRVAEWEERAARSRGGNLRPGGPNGRSRFSQAWLEVASAGPPVEADELRRCTRRGGDGQT